MWDVWLLEENVGPIDVEPLWRILRHNFGRSLFLVDIWQEKLSKIKNWKV